MADKLLLKAREICAKHCPDAEKASNYLAGALDRKPSMLAVMDALRTAEAEKAELVTAKEKAELAEALVCELMVISGMEVSKSSLTRALDRGRAAFDRHKGSTNDPA